MPATLLFTLFCVWASITDIRSLVVKNKMNLAFLLTGLVLWLLPNGSLTLGKLHFIGMVVGFLLLFIPGMIINHAFGGDIKFVSVMGFWVGPYTICSILFTSSLIQLIIHLILRLVNRRHDQPRSITLPFAPVFVVGFFLLWILTWLI